MPELPEVEITARLLDRALAGAEIESALAPGINALKTFDPPLSVLAGQKITGVGRRGKQFVVKIDGPAEPLVLLIHLMSAGRLQLYDKRAGPRDRTSRLLVRIADRPRAAPARVRLQAGRLGEAAARRGARRGPGARDARPRSVAGPAGRSGRGARTRRVRCTRSCATSARSPGSAARGSTRSSGRRSSRRTSAAPTWTRRS